MQKKERIFKIILYSNQDFIVEQKKKYSEKKGLEFWLKEIEKFECVCPVCRRSSENNMAFVPVNKVKDNIFLDSI